MSQHQLTWNQVKERFHGEWVELVQYQWSWRRPAPQWAQVRNHSDDYAELLEKISAEGEVEGAIVLFVGATPESVVAFEPSVANL
jgi:hypothetical protein